MKAEVTLNARRILSRSNLAGGLSPYLPNPAEFPALESHLSYPLQKDLNTQGEVTTLYYAFSKDLKNSGQQFCIPCSNVYETANAGILQVRCVAPELEAGDIIGNVKWTWYVRFHGRTRTVLPPAQILKRAGIKQNVPKQAPQEAAESMMSYADLQAELAAMKMAK